MGLTLLVTGSRDWTDRNVIRQALEWAISQWGVRNVVHGDCGVRDKQKKPVKGADIIAGDQAGQLLGRAFVKPFPAKWKQFGKPAGILRNQQMLDETNPDLCIAFHDDLANSKGTKDMVCRAIKAGLPVFLVTTTDPDYAALHTEQQFVAGGTVENGSQ